MAYCSHIQIVHGATVLLDFNEKIAAPPTINGNQIVDITPLVRSTAPSIIPMGNEQHTIEFTKSAKVDSAFTAIRNALEQPSTFNRTAATVTITVNDSNSDYFELQNAVVESWDSSHDNKRESITYRIIGTLLNRVPVLSPSETWGSHAIKWGEA